MKTTIDLPEEELKEAMRHTGASTKTEAVSLAVADFNRRRRLTELAKRMGTFSALITADELTAARSQR